MRSIAAPTMLVHGSQDRLVPVGAARLAAQVCGGWRLEIFENVGHTPQLEVAGRFVDTVESFCADGVGQRSVAAG
jgi:pimeloyl-ACP methyl ester carboxylesterase